MNSSRSPQATAPSHEDVFTRISPVSRRAGVRAARVFLSSTFRDMHAEREVLIKQVFPELRNHCDRIDVEFSFVDLRWGITEEQVEQGKVLSICLHEIDRCRPFFIGMLGDYYGSVPTSIPREMMAPFAWLAECQRRGSSVTEIEILAVLHHSQLTQRARFFLRDSQFLKSLPPAVQQAWRSTGVAGEQLTALKQRIRQAGWPVTEYATPAALGELVFTQLKGALEDEFGTRAQESSPEEEREQQRHQAFLRQFSRVYVGRRSVLHQLDQHLQGDDPPLVVTGTVGAGKSALISNWLEERQSTVKDLPLFLHVVGATPSSHRWESLATRLLAWLQSTHGLEVEIPGEENPGDLLVALNRTIRQAARSKRLAIVVDGASELQRPAGIPELCWLDKDLPEAVRIVLTGRAGSAMHAEASDRGWRELSLAPLSVTERRALVVGALERVGRTLDADSLSHIVTAAATQNPLFIRVLIQELCTFGVYEALRQRIRHYLDAESLSGLYDRVFQRWEEDYGRELVRDTLVLTAVARNGLLEQDLFALTNPDGEILTSSRLSPFLLSAELEISPRPGVLALTNHAVADAVRSRYLTADAASAARGKLADFYRPATRVAFHFVLNIADDERRKRSAAAVAEASGAFSAFRERAFHELPALMVAEHRWDELKQVLSQPSFLLWASRRCVGDLDFWFRQLAAHGVKAEQLFSAQLQQPASIPAPVLEAMVSQLKHAGEFPAALRAQAALTSRYRNGRDRAALGESLMRESAIHLAAEQFDASRECLQEAEDIFHAVGDEVAAACAQADRGLATFRRAQATASPADLAESARLLRRSLQVLQRAEKTGLLATVYNCLGVALIPQQEIALARDYLQRAEALFRQMGQLDEVGHVYRNRATLEFTVGRITESVDYFRRAERVYRDAGNAADADQMAKVMATALQQRDSPTVQMRRAFFGE